MIMRSDTMNFLFFLLCIITIILNEPVAGYCGDDDTCETRDPRLSYNIDTEDFIFPSSVNITQLYNEITNGSGYVIIPKVFSKEDITHAHHLIHYLLKTQTTKATHFQGSSDAKPDLQARVWNLLDKGIIWEKMVQHPLFMKIATMILGDDFQLGSIATNTIYPGGSGQEPHIDYPYWDYYDRKHWPVPPKVREVPFFMNMQVTVLLDDFTVLNGATAVRPGTQVVAEYPIDIGDFHANMVQTTGKAGDVIIFVGLLQHCAMPNKSNSSRTGVLLQYLPKYIRPMEDIKRSINARVLERATPTMRKLLLLDYPYPAILDHAEGTNSEGYSSTFKWKNTNP